MAQVAWTAEAQQWLRDIYDYIATHRPEAALRTVTGIVARGESLREFPLLGHRYRERSDRHIRILLYGHFRIADLVKADGNIDVLGVFHGSLDLDRYLL